MKILHIVCEYPSKNRPFANIFIKLQIESLKQVGLDITVIDIKSHESKLNYFKSIFTIKKEIKKNKFDLIHAHYSYAGLSAYFAFTKIPVVLSLMGSDLFGVKDTKGNITLKGKFDKMLTKFISKRVDHLIVKSNEMKLKLESEVLSTVIPNGINTNLFTPIDSKIARKELGIPDEEFIILFLGNPDKIVKNFKLAKDVYDAFSKKYNFVRLENPFGIPIEKVVKYMNASNVLILTSFYEGSPNVIKEAMAVNLPIVSTDVGDVRDVIKNTKNCFTADFCTEDFIEKINKIYVNKNRSNGVENIQHLSNEVIAKRIVKLYNQLINKFEILKNK